MLTCARARHATTPRPCEALIFLRRGPRATCQARIEIGPAAPPRAAPDPPKHGGPLEHRQRGSRVDKSARETMRAVGNTAHSGDGPTGTRAPQTSLQRPPKQPPLRPSMADGWSIGAARSARKNRRLLTLSDGVRSGASVGQAWFATRGGGEWSAADLQCACDV